MTKTNNICSNLEYTTGQLREVNRPALAAKADTTLTYVNNLAFRFDTSMKSKDSSLGMLMNDNSIALHVDTTIINMSRLLEDFRLHPKRYVHFSLFGKKDK